MDSTNTLRIVVDSKGAKTNVDNLDDSLKSLETQGDKTSKSAKGVGDGFEKSKKGLIGFNKISNESIEKLKTLAKVSGAVAGAIAATGAAVVGMAASYATAAKDLQNQATLADANVVEFQRMAVAAQSYGITQEQLSDQLKDFNEKLGEFTASGAGGAKDAFEMLHKEGLMTTEQIKSLALEMQKASGPQALQMYVNELEKAGVSQEQMSWYLETMASDLTKLAPALADNGAEMRRLADEAERLGVIMDEKAVAQAVELEKQISLLKKQAQGATNQFMTGLIPSLTSVATALNEGAEKSALFEQAGEDMGAVLKGVTAVAMGAYVAISSVSRAIIATAQDAASAATAISAFDKSSWFKPGQGAKNLLTLGTMTFGGKNNQEAAKTNKKSAESYADFMDKLYKEAEKTTEKINKELAKVGTSVKTGKTKGLDQELAKWGDDGAKAAKAASDKANREAERAAQERERIQYQYADRLKRIELDLARDIQDIREAGFNQSHANNYIQVAKNRADLEKQLYIAQLTEEYSAWRLTEERKLELRKNVNDLSLALNADLTDDMREQARKSIDDQYQYELDQIKLSKETRIFQAEQAFLAEKDIIKKKYELERQEILLNKSLSDDERARLTNASYRSQSIEENAGRESAWGDYKNLMGMSESPYQQDLEILRKAREEMLITEEEFQQQRLGLQLAYGSKYADSFMNTMMGLVDSNSSAYHAMASAQKAFALYTVLMENQVALSKAWASAAFPYNLPAVGAVMVNNGVLAAAVEALSPRGFANGGYTGDGGKYDVAGLVHRGEVVWSQDDVKRAGGVSIVEAMRKSGAKSSNQNNANAPQSQQQPIENNIKVIMVKDEDEAKRMYYSTDFEKAMIYHVKRNRSKLGI